MVLEDADQVAAATHPVRAAVLDAMRSPTTAAEVARRIGQSRQNAAYHVRELHKAGLLRHVADRQRGTFVEQTYEAVADAFVVAASTTWGDRRSRAEALADQASLSALHDAGQRLQRDSALLLDRAAFDGETIASASVVTEVRFADEDARASFLREYVDAVTALARRHGSREGVPHRLLLAAYPDPDPR